MTMYAEVVKRLQILIEEELDAALERQARAEGTSKAALIRRYVGERLGPPRRIQDDPIWEFFGSCDAEPLRDGETIDDDVYGPRTGA